MTTGLLVLGTKLLMRICWRAIPSTSPKSCVQGSVFLKDSTVHYETDDMFKSTDNMLKADGQGLLRGAVENCHTMADANDMVCSVVEWGIAPPSYAKSRTGYQPELTKVDLRYALHPALSNSALIIERTFLSFVVATIVESFMG